MSGEGKHTDFWAIGKKQHMILPMLVNWIMKKMLMHAERKRVKKAWEEQETAQREEEARGQSGAPDGSFPGDFPGGLPGMEGGMPGVAGMPGLNEILSDSEILTARQDPEVTVAFQHVAQKPANMSKYQSNPKVMNLISKLSAKCPSDK
ncbi:hypothetical protein GH733_002198 [Mirounga leonina]|nr:hypothetical protein GH733_002198 [Mirounga leonina]